MISTIPVIAKCKGYCALRVLGKVVLAKALLGILVPLSIGRHI